jgi:hypothetical protein
MLARGSCRDLFLVLLSSALAQSPADKRSRGLGARRRIGLLPPIAIECVALFLREPDLYRCPMRHCDLPPCGNASDGLGALRGFFKKTTSTQLAICVEYGPFVCYTSCIIILRTMRAGVA